MRLIPDVRRKNFCRGNGRSVHNLQKKVHLPPARVAYRQPSVAATVHLPRPVGAPEVDPRQVPPCLPTLWTGFGLRSVKIPRHIPGLAIRGTVMPARLHVLPREKSVRVIGFTGFMFFGHGVDGLNVRAGAVGRHPTNGRIPAELSGIQRNQQTSCRPPSSHSAPKAHPNRMGGSNCK